MKPGKKDKKIQILITGDELTELQGLTHMMQESFGLDSRIEDYQGKRPIGLYAWDFDCLLTVIEDALEDPEEYPEKNTPGYKALNNLLQRLHETYKENFG